MGLKKEVLKIIDDIAAQTAILLKEIDSVGGLTLERKNYLRESLTVIVLSALDDAKLSLEQDEEDLYFLKPLVVALIISGQLFGEVGEGKNVSKLMSSYASLRLKRDPKQGEKKFVNDRWREWQEQPDRYKGKAAFARDMLDKCEHLTSQKKIEDWCREWEKANPAG